MSPVILVNCTITRKCFSVSSECYHFCPPVCFKMSNFLKYEDNVMKWKWCGAYLNPGWAFLGTVSIHEGLSLWG